MTYKARNGAVAQSIVGLVQVALLSAVFAPELFAETDLSPERAVALALEQNLNLTAASARIAASEGLRTQAGLKPNPRLILQSENARYPGSQPFQYARDADTFGYVSQVIERGGKRQTRLELAAQNIKASRISLEAQRAQLTARVLTAYWAAAGAQRLAGVLTESLGILDQTVQYHRDRVREGSLPEVDLIRVQLEHQQVLVSLRNAEQDVHRSVSRLYREIGLPSQSQVRLSGDIAAVPTIEPLDFAKVTERRPDLRLDVQAVQQASAAIRLQRANSVPDPEVLFGYKRTAGFDTALVGFQINLPIRNRNQGAIAAAVAEETAATAVLRANRIAAESEISALTGEYQQKRQLVEQLFPSLRQQAAEMRRIADAIYREGASDLLRLLDAERLRIQTEALYVRSVIDYRQAAISLQAALGLLP